MKTILLMLATANLLIAQTSYRFTTITGGVTSFNTTTLNADTIVDGVINKAYTSTEKTKLGAITGTNTGDNAVNSNYSNDYRAANFIAGVNYLAPNGSAANLTNFPTLNQNTTGSSGNVNGGTANSLTGFSLRSTGAAYDLTMATSEALTANRILNWNVGNAARTITLSGDLTVPATGTAAMIGTAQTFSAAQTFSVSGTVATFTDSGTGRSWRFGSGNFIPVSNNVSDLGGTSNRIANGYFTNVNASGTLSVTGASTLGNLTVNGSSVIGQSSVTLTHPAPSIGTNWTHSGGGVYVSSSGNSSGFNGLEWTGLTLTDGASYLLKFEVTAYTSGNLGGMLDVSGGKGFTRLQNYNMGAAVGYSIGIIVRSAIASNRLVIRCESGWVGTIQNISLTKLPF